MTFCCILLLGSGVLATYIAIEDVRGDPLVPIAGSAVLTFVFEVGLAVGMLAFGFAYLIRPVSKLLLSIGWVGLFAITVVMVIDAAMPLQLALMAGVVGMLVKLARLARAIVCEPRERL